MSDESAEGPELKTMLFVADTAGQARIQASQWLSDFTQHPVLDLQSLTVEARDGRFVATLRYYEG